MSRSLPVCPDEAITQLNSSRIVSSTTYSQACSPSSKILTGITEGNQASILKDSNDKNDAPSHIRHSDILKELLVSMKEQILENCFSISDIDLKTNQDELSLTCTQFSKYQFNKVDPVLICVDTGAPHSCIRDKLLD